MSALKIKTNKNKGATGSLFFVGSFVVAVFVVAILAVMSITNLMYFIPFFLLCVLYICCAGIEQKDKFWRPFFLLQPVFLIMSLFMVFSVKEGRILVERSLFTLTEDGLHTGALLYTRLAILFWISKVLTVLWSAAVLNAGIQVLLFPLRILRIDTANAAHILQRSLRLMPEMLRVFPAMLTHGFSGVEKVFKIATKPDTLNTDTKNTKESSPAYFYYAWMFSGTLLVLSILLSGAS